MDALATLTNDIEAAGRLEEFAFELGTRIADALEAERVNIYRATPDGRRLRCSVRTGLASSRTVEIPATEQSVVGLAAVQRRSMSVRDAFDEVELRALHPALRSLRPPEMRAAYRTRELLGMLLAINNKVQGPFMPAQEGAARRLAWALARCFARPLEEALR